MPKIVDKYRLDSVIGSGQFGKVYKAINLDSNQEFAVKAIKREIFEENPKLKQFVVNEIQTLSRINNEHVVKFFEMITTFNNIYFVYEFCNGGTLEDAIFSQGNYSETEAMVLFKQIVNGLSSIVQLNIIHRDLKPQNILFHNGLIKIADFGFCKPLASRKDLSKTILGSPIYMAPEILLGEEYTMKADIWSLGVLLYEMLFGKCPFEGRNIAQLIDLIHDYDIKFPPEFKVSESTTRLICRMLCRDSSKRIELEAISDALENPASLITVKKQISIPKYPQSIMTSSDNSIPSKIKLETKFEPNSPSLPYNNYTYMQDVHYYTPTHHNRKISLNFNSNFLESNTRKLDSFALSRDVTPSMSGIQSNHTYNKPTKFDFSENAAIGLSKSLQTPTNYNDEKIRSKSTFSMAYGQIQSNSNDNYFKINIKQAIVDKDGFLLFLNKELMKIYYLSQVFSNLHIYKLLSTEFASFELLFLKYLFFQTKKIKESMIDKIDFEITTKITNLLDFIKLPEYSHFEKELVAQLEKISTLYSHQKRQFFQSNVNIDDIDLENDNTFNFKKFVLIMMHYIEEIKKDYLYSQNEKYKATDASKYVIFLNELIDSILIDELFDKFIHDKGNLNGQKYFEDIKQSSTDSILLVVGQKIEFAKSKYKL